MPLWLFHLLYNRRTTIHLARYVFEQQKEILQRTN